MHKGYFAIDSCACVVILVLDNSLGGEVAVIIDAFVVFGSFIVCW